MEIRIKLRILIKMMESILYITLSKLIEIIQSAKKKKILKKIYMNQQQKIWCTGLQQGWTVHIIPTSKEKTTL